MIFFLQLYKHVCCECLGDPFSFSAVKFSSVQFSSVAQSCPTLCNPMNRSTPDLPVHHHLPEFTMTHVHWVRDAIQPSHPRSSPSPPALNPSQHQSLFQWAYYTEWSKSEIKMSIWYMMCLNCGVGEDSWESLGLQGDPTSPFWRRSTLGFLWKEWC